MSDLIGLFNAIKGYMDAVVIDWSGYHFSMWDVSMTVIMLFALMYVINRFLYIEV